MRIHALQCRCNAIRQQKRGANRETRVARRKQAAPVDTIRGVPRHEKEHNARNELSEARDPQRERLAW